MAKTSRTLRVLIADDHPVFRSGLRKLLEAKPGLKVIGEAADAGEAVKQAQELEPDILLLDLTMAGQPGFDTLRALSAAGLRARTILLAGAISDEQILRALRLGARGVIRREAATDLLLKCVRLVGLGQCWVGREVVSDLVAALRRSVEGAALANPNNPFNLTRRELEIVRAVVAGSSNREIAERLAVREDTIKHHLTSIFAKTGLTTRVALALFAVDRHLAGAPERSPRSLLTNQ
jgi:two-component system, NarL family, nitrate/nitrite response regulator NarL